MSHAGMSFPQLRVEARRALGNPDLQLAVKRATAKFHTGRIQELSELPDVDAMRDHFKQIRAATLAHLADHLETFERRAREAGAQVHWARDAAEANAIVIDLIRQHGETMVVKSKSMATEETRLNDALLEAGITPVETDLGEWIIQLAGEPPSHIVGPALHKTRQQVAELLSREVGRELSPDDIPGMTEAARGVLREKFLRAKIGISGANIGIAETGSIVLVTNEGNGRMVTSATQVHIAVMGIEKLTPTWDDAAVWVSLLARSGTGQPLSIYTNVITGPARPGDPDGPREVHIVLLDNGRSRLLGTTYEEVLQCIRCGACLNICPVYQSISGHAYGSPYSGPIGAVISPLLFGLEEYHALPHASSLCGACKYVCPARIDLPRMLLALRADLVKQDIIGGTERLIEESIAELLAHQRLFNGLTDLGRVGQIPLARGGALALPTALNPAGERSLPCLAPRSFHEIWPELAGPGEAQPSRYPPRRLILAALLVGLLILLRTLFRREEH